MTHLSKPYEYGVQVPASVPVRTCIGCRTRAPKSEMVRIVWDGDAGRLRWDRQGHRPGRGAWLHATAPCLEKATKRKAFGRALRLSNVSFDPSVLSLEDLGW